MPNPDASFLSVDENAVHRFEQAWVRGDPDSIEECLPAAGHRLYLPTLEELILIDMEFRWKKFGRNGPRTNSAELHLLESYVRRFPSLNDPPILRRLIRHEYSTREAAGDRPTLDEYGRRFPDLAVTLNHLTTKLISTKEGADGRLTVDAIAPNNLRELSFPAQFGNYELLGILGRGGMGVVFKARQKSVNRLVALKMILAGEYASSAELHRFQVEAEAVAGLQHPNVVQLFEFGSHDGRHFITLELVEGPSLARKAGEGPMPGAEAARIVLPIARSVAAAHHRGIIHRDLKPENVLMTADGQPKITDFGLAKQTADLDSPQNNKEQLTRTGAIMGTPSYMSPEQARGEKTIGPATDIYALGAILYRLLTGKPLFTGATSVEIIRKVIDVEPAPPRQLIPGISRDLETICQKCLRKNAEDRYNSALALAHDLERYLAGEAVLARPEGVLRKAGRKFRRHRVALLAGGLVAAALVVAAVFALSSRKTKQASDLATQIQVSLDDDDWSPEKADAVESLISRLSPLDPTQAQGFTDRFRDRYRQAIARVVKKPRLDEVDRAWFVANIQALTQRDADGAEPLRQQWEQRLGQMEVVLDLAAPFAGWQEAIETSALQVDEERLTLAANVNGETVIATKTASTGKAIRAEVDFDRNWGQNGQIALFLNYLARSDKRRESWYRFDLSFETRKSSVAGFEGSDESKTAPGAFLKIFRNHSLLREKQIAIAPGPLLVRASRSGDQLTLQVNQQEPIAFVDPFPLDTRNGVFAFSMSPDVKLASLRAYRQGTSALQSPIEVGDEQYLQGNYAEALKTFEQIYAAASLTEGLEARHKAGSCLWRLNRQQEAVDALTRAAAAGDDRWSGLAACQLWVVYLDRNDMPAANNVFLSLSAKFKAEDLLRLVPEELTKLIERKYLPRKLDLIEPDRVQRLEMAVKVNDFLCSGNRGYGFGWLWSVKHLAQAYESVGQASRGVSLLRNAIREARSIPTPLDRDSFLELLLIDYGKLMRITGNAQKMLDELEHSWPEQHDKTSETEWLRARIAIERVRLYARLGNDREAEAAADRLLAMFDDPRLIVEYHYYATAQLMKGMIQLKSGDRDGASATFRAGVRANWQAKLRGMNLPADRLTDTRDNVIMAAFSDQLTEADVEELKKEHLDSLGDSGIATTVRQLVPITPKVAKSMWNLPSGKELARQLAFDELGVRGAMVGQVKQLALGVINVEAIPEMTPEQEGLLSKTLESMLNQFIDGKIGRRQIVTLGLIWKGANLLASFDSAKLSAEHRPAMAYLFGFRYRQLNDSTRSREFFEIAAKEAAEGSRLKALARLELQAGSSKK